MSNKRIDHAAEALDALSEAWDARNSPTDGSARALAHATLALVEQQRVANLLRSGAIGGGPMSNDDPGEVQSYLRRKWPDIAAALGVER